MKNLRFLPDAREEVLNNFKSNLFLLENPISKAVSEPTSEQLVFYKLKQT